MSSERITTFLATALVLLAVVVGCSSEPAKQSQAEPAQTTPQELLATELKKAEAQAVTVASAEEESLAVTGREGETEPAQLLTGKQLSLPGASGSVSPRNDEFHDTGNNAIVVLQSPTTAMMDFPRDRRNEVDWVKTLDGGYIEPRADLKGKGEMITMDMDIVMKNTQNMPYVRFPHKAHTKWLACENCHPKIFEPKEHANPISMNKVLRGEFCGVCHDKVAFSLFVCERCHSVPHKGSGPAWWKK
ncbi:c(7)-type cytochrome triheme domain-containing protein [Kaarinaea lacus]